MANKRAMILPGVVLFGILIVLSSLAQAERITARDNLTKTLTHESFPEVSIKVNEPKICDPNVKQLSGYLDLQPNKHLFFWFFESRNNPNQAPVVLWLNGGPGCSSLGGLYFEMGPCSVSQDGTSTVLNANSWNNNANVLFLDQPIGVGYSFGDGSISTSTAAADDIYAFLQIFYKNYPQYANLDFHIAGGSYAGHYIPVVASEINNKNKMLPPSLVHINLMSILIGNGIVDSLNQYPSYQTMACANSYNKQLLPPEGCFAMKTATRNCVSRINSCYAKSTDIPTCNSAMRLCNDNLLTPITTKLNPYDIRDTCGPDLFKCYPALSAIEKFSNRNDIKQALGISNTIQFKICSSKVFDDFSRQGDWMQPYHQLIPDLLKSNINVLIYAGDSDYICNWYGNDAWTKALNWEGKDGFNAAQVAKFITTKTSTYAGDVRTFKGLTFLRVFQAGHFVAHFQPEVSLDFFNKWISKQPL